MRKEGIFLCMVLTSGIIPVPYFSIDSGIPYLIPQAHAATNANLFVSAENSQFNNYFAGPQVIQVIVSDPDIQRLDQAYGEPTVTVNGKKLRMAQATDGNWYAYFADSKQAQTADSTAPVAKKGLNFGQFCSATSAVTATGADFSETKGVAIATTATGAAEGTQTPLSTVGATCTALASTTTNEHVIRENKTLNSNAGNVAGQIGLSPNAWPVIQLYDFAGFPATVTVDYQKAGGDQIVNLTFDRIPTSLINSSVDRTAYPENSQVFVTLNDPQLNIDPTEEDSWTWGANAANNTLYYMAFTRNGGADADGTTAMQNLIGNLTNFMFNHNGKFTLNPKAQTANVIEFQDNGKQVLTSTDGTGRGQINAVRTNSIGLNSAPVTFIESGGVNTGNFVTWDGGKVSDLITSNSLAIRGQSATMKYNDVGTSIVGGFGYASLSMSAPNGTWSSGEKIPITLNDIDANKNIKIAEHLNNYDSSADKIPTMRIGDPLTVESGNGMTAIFTNGGLGGALLATVSDVSGSEGVTSGRAMLEAHKNFNFTTGGSLIIDLHNSGDILLKTINNVTGSNKDFRGFNMFNYDVRSLTALNGQTGSFISSIQAYLVVNNFGTRIIDNFGNVVNPTSQLIPLGSGNTSDLLFLNHNALLKDQQPLTDLSNIAKTASIGLMFTFTTNGPVIIKNLDMPIVADFFSIGIKGDGLPGERINNAIYRFELEETGDNTGIFTGTTEFTMLNQLGIFDPVTYSSLRTINNEIKFAAIENMIHSEDRSSQITYLDLGADGIDTLISAQQDIQTHTGIPSFDKKNYKVGDTVTITVSDRDLNIDNDLVDIYTTVVPSGNLAIDPQDVAVDTIGIKGLGTNSKGSAFGKLFEVVFGNEDTRWSNAIISGDSNHMRSCTFAGGDVNSGSATTGGYATSLSATGFSLVETGPSTGIFTGTFEFPDELCQNGNVTSTSGENIKVKYFDFADRSGKLSERDDYVGGFGFVDTLKIVPQFASFTTINQVYPQPQPNENVPVLIFFKNSEAIKSGIAELSNLGIIVNRTIDIVPSASAIVPASKLDNISNKYAVAIFRDSSIYPSSSATNQEIEADQVWQLPSHYKGSDITIAILDTGIDKDNTEFQGFKTSLTLMPWNCHSTVYPLFPSDCIDKDGHGSHVAGIAMAPGITDPTLEGVAPIASIMAIQVIDPSGVGGSIATLGQGIDWAVKNSADVINMSVETGKFGSNCDQSSDGMALLPYMIAATTKGSGTPLIAASGNNFLVAAPACISYVIAVGAVEGATGLPFNDTNHWPNPLASAEGDAMKDHGLVAPGVQVRSTWSTHSTDASSSNTDSGTSMSAPVVAGTVALMLDKIKHDPKQPLTPKAIAHILFKTACTDIPCITPAISAPDSIFGHGRVNALAAVKSLDLPPLDDFSETSTSITLSSNAVTIGQVINVTVSVLDASDVPLSVGSVKFDDGNKAGVFSPTFCSLSSGSCIVTYTPQSVDPDHITAVYQGDGSHDSSFKSEPISISIPAAFTYQIPNWIRNNAKWWHDNEIGDDDFIKGIQYLIQQGIMKIPQTQAGSSSSKQIPSWIKNNAGGWADGTVSDDDFVKGIQYLIQVGIIKANH